MAAVGLFASSRPAHTAGGPVPVAVSNLPLPTVPTDEAAPTEPFQTRLQPSAATGGVAAVSFTVPSGKRLVIEDVSSAVVPQSNDTTGVSGFVELLTTAGGQTVPHFLADTHFAQNRQNMSVRYYADPGSTVTAQTFSSVNGSPGAAGADVELSGYYVDVP